MKTTSILLPFLVLPIVFASRADAQSMPETSSQPIVAAEKTSALHKENSLNISPLGVLSGSYGLTYERLLQGHHGIIVEGNYASASGSDASSSSAGATIGYRYHWRGNQDSGFVGLNLGYYDGSGTATVESGGMSTTFDMDTKVTTLTANIGRRWAWDSGLNVTFRIGLGQGNYDITTKSDDPDAQKAVELVDDLLTLFPVAFDGELSMGYIF